MNPPLFSPVPLKKPQEKIDPELEASITTFTDAILEDEKKRFQPGVESFQMHSSRIQEEIRNSMVEFQQKLQKGYEIVTNWLNSHGISPPVISEENIALLHNREEYLKRINEGRALYEILGFTVDTLKNLYNAAYQLMQDKDFVKARDACFFLVTISPHTADFWLGLAISATQLKEYDTALEATLRAIECNPKNLKCYLNGVHLYLQKNDAAKAASLCIQGIDFAKSCGPEEWAKDFISKLEEALTFVKTI